MYSTGFSRVVLTKEEIYLTISIPRCNKTFNEQTAIP
jgi:hypothetical protein